MDKIESHSVDLVLCDLPYGTTANKWDSVIPFEDLWRQYERIVKPNGNIILFGAGLFAFKLALSNEKLFRYDMVWKKSKCGSPLTAPYMPLKKHEMILVFGKPGAYYDAQTTEGTPYKRNFTPHKMNNMQYGIKGVQIDNPGVRQPTTILDFPQKWRRQDQVHPTQKPVELFEFLIRQYCPQDGIVLDNCMGSGTTAIAAIRSNRNYIGFELNKDYYDICIQRIDDERNKHIVEAQNIETALF